MEIHDDELYVMTLRTRTGVTMEMTVKGEYADAVQRKLLYGQDDAPVYIQNELGEEIVIRMQDIEYVKVRE
ncbi:MAG: hypothetical protein GX171_02550 [Clostridiales bacterium]|jgi:hypothetical protein|nr:hypothetical protein [Clostridiales bacterium]